LGQRIGVGQQEGANAMKSLLGLAVIASLALALPASAAEKATKEPAAKPAAASTMAAAPAAPMTHAKKEKKVKH